MNHYDLWGPHTGNALHAPATPRHYRKAHLSIQVRIFIVLAAMAIIGGGLAAIN